MEILSKKFVESQAEFLVACRVKTLNFTVYVGNAAN